MELTRRDWWQIQDDLRCPVIGTCLTTEEQRGILRKLKVPVKELEDVVVHRLLVHSCDSDSPIARRVQLCLESKYRRDIREWGTCQERDLLPRWGAGLQCGKIDAALWITATHPGLSEHVVSKISGDVHMLMHRQGEVVRQKLQQIEQQSAQIQQLRDKLHKAQARGREIAQALHASEISRAELELKLSRLRESPKQDEDIDSRLARLEKAERQIQTQEAVIERLKEENRQIIAELASTNDFNNAMRAALRDMLETLQQEADTCQPCANRDLCEKRILLVGGMTRLRAIYQVLIEDMGGEFKHNDGRTSGGDREMVEQVRWADIVLCPVDINSHGACLSVKKACKRMNKPCHLLPSSGVSSIARALTGYCSAAV